MKTERFNIGTWSHRSWRKWKAECGTLRPPNYKQQQGVTAGDKGKVSWHGNWGMRIREMKHRRSLSNLRVNRPKTSTGAFGRKRREQKGKREFEALQKWLSHVNNNNNNDNGGSSDWCIVPSTLDILFYFIQPWTDELGTIIIIFIIKMKLGYRKVT